jgi:hypothetical protein
MRDGVDDGYPAVRDRGYTNNRAGRAGDLETIFKLRICDGAMTHTNALTLM